MDEKPENHQASNASFESEVGSEQGKAEWLRSLCEEFLKIEPFVPFSFLPPEEACPEWVRRVEREFSLAVFPVARLKEATVLTPMRMGAMLGHQCANVVWMTEWMQAQFAEVSKVEQSITEDQARQAQALINSLPKWYEALRQLAKTALSSCVDQTYQEMSEFLTAYASAFARKPKSFGSGDIGNTNFEIYVYMLTHWRLVERLQSVSQLHGVLQKVFGENKVGNLKRIEKICQRIELRLGKPGRPKKTK